MDAPSISSNSSSTFPPPPPPLPSSSILSRDQQKMLAFLSDWWISIGIVASLLLQILLLLTGGTRKWNRASRAIAWSAYNMSDFTATLVLGGLAQTAAGSGRTIYAVWAPMLLLHLGAPDNISAYAAEDAELWQRHGLTMLLQVASAAYVVANCATTWRYTVVGVCLLATGGIKYAERTLALRHATRDAIRRAAQPIYEFMRLEAWLPEDFRHLPGRNPPPPPPPPPPAFSRSTTTTSLPPSETTTTVYHYIITGEAQWFPRYTELYDVDSPEVEDDLRAHDAAAKSPELVTLHDILSSRDLRSSRKVVLICAGFSLFKLVRRRLCHLFMYEWRQKSKTPAFFFSRKKSSPGVFHSDEDLLFVLDVELRFLFDSLYTKASGTAFTAHGVVFRFGTTLLLLVSAIFLVSPAMKLQLQASLVEQSPSITFFLLAAAIIVEAYQLLRIALSDWTKVWLSCMFIRVQNKISRLENVGRSTLRAALLRRWVASGLLELIRMVDSIARHKYWSNRIGQYAMAQQRSSRGVTGGARGGGERDMAVAELRRYLASLLGLNSYALRRVRYDYDESTVERFKCYVLRKVLQSCAAALKRSSREPTPTSMVFGSERISDIHNMLKVSKQPNGADCFVTALGNPYTDYYQLIINWHIATCFCEMLDRPGGGLMTELKRRLEENRRRKVDLEVLNGGGSSSSRSMAGGIKSGTAEHGESSMSAAGDDVEEGGGGEKKEGEEQRYKKALLEAEEEVEEGLRGAEEVRKMCGILSRYMAYLLVHKTELLPCHPDIARQMAEETENALQSFKCRDEMEVLRMVAEEDNENLPNRLQLGILTTRTLMEIEDGGERWSVMLAVWVEILMCAAGATKVREHLRQLTLGGEFLTDIWLLLGHMGFCDKPNSSP